MVTTLDSEFSWCCRRLLLTVCWRRPAVNRPGQLTASESPGKEIISVTIIFIYVLFISIVYV